MMHDVQYAQLFHDVTSRGRVKSEDNQSVVCHDAPESRIQVTTQSGVVIKPPERRPAEHHVPQFSILQSFELSNRGGVINRRAGVMPVMHWKRNRTATV